MGKDPLYGQIEAELRGKIDCGEYRYGQSLPSERVMAEQYGVNRVTVRTALERMVEDGLVTKLPGKGAFVSMPKLKRRIYKLNSFRAMLKETGVEPEDKILYLERMRAGFRLSSIFGIAKEDPVYRVFRLRLGNGEPMAIEDTFLPYHLIEGIEEVDFSVISLYELLSYHGVQLKDCAQELRVIRLPALHAELLGLEAGAAAFQTTFLTRDESGRVVEYTEGFNNPAKFTFVTDLKPVER